VEFQTRPKARQQRAKRKLASSTGLEKLNSFASLDDDTPRTPLRTPSLSTLPGWHDDSPLRQPQRPQADESTTREKVERKASREHSQSQRLQFQHRRHHRLRSTGHRRPASSHLCLLLALSLLLPFCMISRRMTDPLPLRPPRCGWALSTSASAHRASLRARGPLRRARTRCACAAGDR
jgi:hypothetical protein